jgi:hypothetical protein
MSIWSFLTIGVIAIVIWRIFPEASSNMRLKVEADMAAHCMENRTFGAPAPDTNLVRWCTENAKSVYRGVTP